MQAWMRQARERQRRSQLAGESHVFGQLRDQARQEYASWFEQLPWQWFATLTLVMGGRESPSFAWRSHRRWSRVMHQEAGRELRQVVALEFQKRGTAHLHALTYGARPDADPFHAMKVWESVSGGGYARVFPYIGQGGAASYCSKYVAKDCELRLVGPWPAYNRQLGIRT